MRLTASLAGLALVAACSSGEDGWRPLTADEAVALDRQAQAQNPWLKAAPQREAVADFDGDGRNDRAVVRVDGGPTQSSFLAAMDVRAGWASRDRAVNLRTWNLAYWRRASIPASAAGTSRPKLDAGRA